MKEITEKKAKRNENKKKKRTAEIELRKLNEKDKEEKKMLDISKRERKISNIDEPTSNATDISEPKAKRHKKENNKLTNETADCHASSADWQTSSTDTGNTSNIVILPNNNTILYDEELANLRRALRERKKFLKTIPRLKLKTAGEEADLSQVTKRTPLFLSDIQHLLMYSQLGQHSPYDPRWAVLEKCSQISHTLLILVEGATLYDYIANESTCPNLAKMEVRIELVPPVSYGGSVVEEICAVPLSKTQRAKLERKFGNLNYAVQSNDQVFKVLRSMFSIKRVSLPTTNNGCSSSHKLELPATDKFPRTALLLSAWQLVEEGYPLPLQGELSTRYTTYILTKDEYSEVTSHSPMWGLDCEMCQTHCGNELTRISIVNENMQVVYETLVKPYNKIINYLTQYSGITSAMLTNVTKRLEDVQADLRKLLPSDVILVGQSLNMDLHALQMMHPYIIDTSVIFNLSGQRQKKSKLSVLTAIFLNKVIQQGSSGHDSVEDSIAALELVKLKLSKSLEFGDAVLDESQAYNTRSVSKAVPKKSDKPQLEFNLATSLFSHVTSQNKTVSLISSNQILPEYTPFITAAAFGPEECTKVECQVTNSNVEAMEKTFEVMSKHEFCLTHVKLEKEENIVNIDQWTSQILRNEMNYSLVIVVLAGSAASNSHGAAFLHIQKPTCIIPRTGIA